MRPRQLVWWVVSQMCVMSAGPSMAASSNVVCPSISTLGEIFQPAPRCAAQAAPVPSIARAPPPLAPSKFSGLIDRDCTPVNRVRERRSITSSPRFDATAHLSRQTGGVVPLRRGVLPYGGELGAEGEDIPHAHQWYQSEVLVDSADAAVQGCMR